MNNGKWCVYGVLGDDKRFLKSFGTQAEAEGYAGKLSMDYPELFDKLSIEQC